MKNFFTNTIRFISQQFSPGLKCCFGFILMVVIQLSVTGQATSIKVSGKITSGAGEPLQGVTVGEKNTTNMTITDATGSFALAVPDNAVLEITYVGFNRQEVSVAGKTELLIKLEAVENTLQDVVVVGYSSQKRGSIT